VIRIEKEPVPAVLVAHSEEWREEYAQLLAGEDVPAAARTRYRHADIKAALRREARDKCAYCESRISHVYPGDADHISPVVHRPDLIVEWQNLAYVCAECNRRKGDYYAPAEPLINPYMQSPEDHLVFYGPIVLQRPGNFAGLRTVERLALGRTALVERRRERIEALQPLLDLYAITPPGADRDLIWGQIRGACDATEEYSAFLGAFVYQSGLG